MNFYNDLGWFDDTSVGLLVAALISVVLALIVHRLGSAVIKRITRGLLVASAVARRCWRPSRFVLPLLAMQAV